MIKVRIFKEDVNLYDINPRNLTNDCYTVIRKSGQVDVVRAQKAVHIFDFYYDLGIRLQRIDMSEGRRNPRTQECDW